MIKAFCDRCDNPCNPATAGSRKFDLVGLDIRLSKDGEIGPNIHACDECFPAMLLEAAQTFENAEVIVNQTKFFTDAKDFKTQQAKIDARVKALAIKEEQAAEKLAAAEELLAVAEKKIESSTEQVNLLQAQVRSLSIRLGTAMKIDSAQVAQAEIDKEDSPEYASRVWKRERIRAS